MDRKRSLLGRLLIRRACARALGTEDFAGLDIGRTHGQKPFLRAPLPKSLPNFNFNISHDGHWVVLASDPLRLIGVDITAPQRARGDSEDDSFLCDLENLMYAAEQARIGREPTVRGRYSVFQRIWSAKEALTKAVGEGLDFGLDRIEVTLDGRAEPDPLDALWGWLGQWRHPEAEGSPQRSQAPPPGLPEAVVSIDFLPRPEWSLQQRVLPGDHWLTVALGPVEQVKDRNMEFSTTLRVWGIDSEARRRSLETPAPEFEVLPVASLVPESLQARFACVSSSVENHYQVVGTSCARQQVCADPSFYKLKL